MGFLLQNQLEVSIYIDDIEYPLGDTNLLNSLHITTTVRGSVPLLSMSINDVQHIFDKTDPQDGIPIRVVLKPQGKQTKTYLFRKYNHDRDQAGGTNNWLIYGYCDVPIYWNTTTCVGIKGTSSDVLSQIAQICDLKYDGVSTSDSQLWLPKNKAYRSFAKDVCDNGYVNDQSCMQLGVDLDSTMRYKDVNNLPPPTRKIIAYQYEQGSTTAMEFAISADSGFNNAISGYQNARYVQSAVGSLVHTLIKDLSFTPDSKSPLYNKALKTLLNRGPVRFGPIDVGNVHEKYEQASYQNMRYRNLLSMGLNILLSTPSDFQLMEQINFSAQREDASQDKVNSGVYIVTGHSLFVQGGAYFEKLGVVRHGSNANYVDG